MRSTHSSGAKPYGVALSSASEFSMGAGLVSQYTRCETREDAAALAARIGTAQPGIIAAVAVETPNGWTVNGRPVSEWISENA